MATYVSESDISVYDISVVVIIHENFVNVKGITSQYYKRQERQVAAQPASLAACNTEMLHYFNGEWQIHDVLWAKLPLLTEGTALEAQRSRPRSLSNKAPDADVVSFPRIASWCLQFQYAL